MKKIFVLSVFAIFLVAVSAGFAQQPETEAEISEYIILKEAGTLPDSWFYGFKRFGEGVQEFFTFDPLEKAKLKYDIAEIRLMEAEVMAREGKQDLSDSSMKEYENRLAETEKDKRDISSSGRDASPLSGKAGDNAYKHILVLQKVYEKVPGTAKPAIEKVIEDSLERHSSLMGIEDARKVDFNILLDDKVLGKSVSPSFAEKVLEREDEVEKEFDREVELENKEGLRKKLAEISGRFEDSARREIDAQKGRIASLKSRDINGSVLDEAESVMEDAERKFGEGKFRESLDSALAGSSLARVAEKIGRGEFEKAEMFSRKIDVNRNRAELEIEDAHDRMVELERRVSGISVSGSDLHVRAETLGGSSEVTVRKRFDSAETDKDKIIDEIIREFELTRAKADAALKIQPEDDNELESKFEVDVDVRREGTEIEVEMRFVLNSTSRGAILDSIVQKTKLTKEQILAALEFEDRRAREGGIVGGEAPRFKVRAEIVGNRAEVKLEKRFSTADTGRDDIIRDIMREFELTRAEADGLLRMEIKAEDRLREKFEAKADVKDGMAEVEIERRFILAATDRDAILNAIVEKSKLTKAQIEVVLELEIEREREKREVEIEIEREAWKEVEVEIEGNEAKVKVKIGGAVARFDLQTTDRNEIIKEIRKRTTLGSSEIEKIIKIEQVRSGQERKREIERERETEIERDAEKRKIEIEIEKEIEIRHLIENAKEHLRDSEDAFDDIRHGEAFGHAAIASRIVDDAREIEIELEDIRREDRREDRREPEIRGRIAEGEADPRGQEPEAERGGAGEIRGRIAEGEVEPESGRNRGGSSGSSSGSGSSGGGSSDD